MTLAEYEKFHFFMIDRPGGPGISGFSGPEVLRDCSRLAEFYLAVIAGTAFDQARCVSVSGHGWRIPPRHLAEVFRPPHRLLPALWAASVSWPGENLTLLVRDRQVAGFASALIRNWERATVHGGCRETGVAASPRVSPVVIDCREFVEAKDASGVLVVDDVMDVWAIALEEGLTGPLWNRLEMWGRILGVTVSARSYVPEAARVRTTPVGLPDFLEGVFSTVSTFPGNSFGRAEFVLYDAGEAGGRREREDSVLVMVIEALIAGPGDIVVTTGTGSEAIDLAGNLEGPARSHGRTVWCGGENPESGPFGILFVTPAPAKIPGRVKASDAGGVRRFRAPGVVALVIASIPSPSAFGWQMPHGIGTGVFAELVLRRTVAACSQTGVITVTVPSWLAETCGPVVENLVSWFNEAVKKSSGKD